MKNKRINKLFSFALISSALFAATIALVSNINSFSLIRGENEMHKIIIDKDNSLTNSVTYTSGQKTINTQEGSTRDFMFQQLRFENNRYYMQSSDTLDAYIANTNLIIGSIQKISLINLTIANDEQVTLKYDYYWEEGVPQITEEKIVSSTPSHDIIFSSYHPSFFKLSLLTKNVELSFQKMIIQFRSEDGGCEATPYPGTGETEQLLAPSNVSLDDENYLSFTLIENSSGYKIKIVSQSDASLFIEEELTGPSNISDLINSLELGLYDLYIKSLGDDINYSDSEYIKTDVVITREETIEEGTIKTKINSVTQTRMNIQVDYDVIGAEGISTRVEIYEVYNSQDLYICSEEFYYSNQVFDLYYYDYFRDYIISYDDVTETEITLIIKVVPIVWGDFTIISDETYFVFETLKFTFSGSFNEEEKEFSVNINSNCEVSEYLLTFYNYRTNEKFDINANAVDTIDLSSLPWGYYSILLSYKEDLLGNNVYKEIRYFDDINIEPGEDVLRTPENYEIDWKKYVGENNYFLKLNAEPNKVEIYVELHNDENEDSTYVWGRYFEIIDIDDENNILTFKYHGGSSGDIILTHNLETDTLDLDGAIFSAYVEPPLTFPEGWTIYANSTQFIDLSNHPDWTSINETKSFVANTLEEGKVNVLFDDVTYEYNDETKYMFYFSVFYSYDPIEYSLNVREYLDNSDDMADFYNPETEQYEFVSPVAGLDFQFQLDGQAYNEPDNEILFWWSLTFKEETNGFSYTMEFFFANEAGEKLFTESIGTVEIVYS